MTARVWLPARADLDAATARTAAAIADPSASPADLERAAEIEEALYAQIEPGPCDRPADPPPLESRIDWSPEIDAEAAGDEDDQACPRCGAVSWGMTPDGLLECTRCLWPGGAR